MVHLLRAHLVEQTQEMCDTLQDALIDTVRQLIGQPGINADQLQLAKLPVTAGGLGLPDLPTLALVARASCIATLPRADHTDSFRKDLVKREGEGCSWNASEALAKDTPPPLSLRHLSRKLTKSIQSRAISDLSKRRAELGDIFRHQWVRNLPGDAPARPESYRGHGEWLHCLPGKWETTLLDPVFRLGLCQRLGFPAFGAGQQCGRTPPGGKRCQHILDPYGRHAACCTKGLHTRRHDRIRDLIAKLARQAGLTATTEQAMLIPDQIQEDGQPAPGSVRPIHRVRHSKAVSDLWKRRAELEDTLRHQWFRNLPGDSSAQPNSYHGHGEWLHCLPGKWETTLLDPGLSQQLGYRVPGTGQRCG